MASEERLIEMVKCYPCLYDKKDPKYKDHDAKSRAWSAIANAISREEMDCKETWMRLSWRFVVELNLDAKCKVGDSGKEQWYYMEAMQFFAPYLLGRGISSPSAQTSKEPKMEPSTGINPESTAGITVIRSQSASRNNNDNVKEKGGSLQNTPSSRTSIENKISVLLDKVDNFLGTKPQEASPHDAYLRIIADYIDNVERDKQNEFRFSLINFVSKEFEKYKNK